MGRQKIDRLLTQLKSSHQQDVQNAAAIFTVAQGAVNELGKIDEEQDEALAIAPALLQEPLQLTKADLISRYGDYNACRKAAKKAGVVFSKTPRWDQLAVAFSYVTACQSCVANYVAQNPNPNLKGISIAVVLDG